MTHRKITPELRRRVLQAYRDLVAEGSAYGEVEELARGWGLNQHTLQKWAREERRDRGTQADVAS